MNKSTILTGTVTAFLTSLITLISFLVVKPPISGPFCLENCIGYPYTEILDRFPQDYIWMYFMIVMLIVYIVFMVSLHRVTNENKKMYSQAGLAFAIIAAAILLINYFVQISVIQPSIINGETDGIALLTQYNPHGVFIALEELGYLLITVSFFFLALIFNHKSRLDRSIRITFLTGFILSILSLIVVLIKYGLDREYIYECIVIVIAWLVLIINGILIGLRFSKDLKKA